MSILGVETTTEYGATLIIITTETGDRYHYMQDKNGAMILGQPFLQTFREYRVHMFLPIPHGYPTILSIEG